MRSRRRFVLGLLAVLAVLACQPATAEPWPTTRFEIVNEGPEGQSAAGPLSRETKASLETWLSRVAEYYQSLGFRAPDLEPLVATDEGGRAYRIYLFDLMAETGLDGLYIPRCTPITPRLRFNYDSVVGPDGRRTERSWPLMAHELFHAVQGGYPMFTETCRRGDWITEGTAEAIGVDTAWRLASVEKNPDLPTIRWGGRRYDVPLYIRTNGDRFDRDAYRTASFWRYLAEVAAAGQGQPGSALIAGDYSYLADLFETGSGIPGTEAAELDWIDRALTQRFRIGLPMMMTAFAASVESWVPARGRAPDRSADDNRAAWRRALFDGCERAVLSPDRPTVTVFLPLEPVAADCILVTATIDGQAAIEVTTKAEDEALVRAIGVGGRQGVQIPTVQVWKQQEGPWHGRWSFSLPGGSDEVLVVTNVAARPADTRGSVMPIALTLNGFSSSLTRATPERPAPEEQGPPAPDPAESDTAAAPEPPRDRVADAAAQRIAAGLEAATASANASTSVGRNPQALPCAEPFLYLACGPSTRISLRLSPGDALDMAATFGRGGIAGQFAAMVEGMQQMGMAEAIMGQQEAMQRLAGTPGAEIVITIPMIDYGFTGGFANAYISVADGDGGALVSVGPGDAIPGPGRGFPLAGEVSIETYSPTVMIGSFSGRLVDPGENLSGDDAPRTVVTSIEGRFHIASPFAYDRRFDLQDPPDPVARAQEDLALAFPELRGMIDEALEEAGVAASAPGGSIGTAGSGDAACDCSCTDPAAAAQANPACASVCATTRATCTATASPAASPATADAGGADGSEIERLRRHFAEGMGQQGWPDSMIEGFLGVFDTLETLDEKRLYMTSMGIAPPEAQPAQ